VLLIILPGNFKNKKATAFTSSLLVHSPPFVRIGQASDFIRIPDTTEIPLVSSKSEAMEQASAIHPSTADNNTGSTLPLLVTTQVQAENLLDQGYSVHDIARELELSRKEVRKLKRRLKREEKATIQQRRKDKMKNDKGDI
jgi:hypothetical protein